MRSLVVAAFCALLLGVAVFGQSTRPDKAARMDALFKECARPGVPGASVIIVRDGRVLFKKSYGLADVEKQVRATPATNYRLASLTKQFTAMAIMILGDRGKLSFDQRLSEFFPELPAYAKSVTIRQILNHQSGLPDYEGLVPAAAPEVVESPAEQLKDKDVLGFLQKQQRLLFEPGSQYRYSNTGYVVLGLLVERVSGLSYSQFLKKDIFDPLGMAGTVAHVEGVTTVPGIAPTATLAGEAARQAGGLVPDLCAPTRARPAPRSAMAVFTRRLMTWRSGTRRSTSRNS